MYFLFLCIVFFIVFFFNDTATTEIYTLSLHDALPIFWRYHFVFESLEEDHRAREPLGKVDRRTIVIDVFAFRVWSKQAGRSEEHTSELQSQFHLVCRLLLEKKKKPHKPSESRQTLT